MKQSSPGAALLLALALMFVSTAAHTEVQISGISGDLLSNAQAHLSLNEEECEAPAWRVKKLFRKGRQEIATAMQTYGYYAAEVESVLGQTNGCWLAQYTVEAGEPVRVRSLEVVVNGEAASDLEIAGIIADSTLQQDQAFRHDHYESLKRSLLDGVARRGYADAELKTHAVSVFPAEHAADVSIVLASGRRYVFGETIFMQEVLTPELVAGFLPYRRGAPYDNRLLADLYSVLSGSGYFARIQVEPDLESRRDGEIPVRVSLTSGKRKVYTAGIGFSTDTGPRLRAGYTNRRIDAKGHQWGTSMLMSTVVSEVTANYRRPRGDPRTEWLSFDLGFKHESTDTSRSDAYQFGVRRIKQRANNWRENRFVDLLREDFVISDQSDTSTLVIPGISWSRTVAENRLRPERGSRLFLELRASGDALGSDTSFLRIDSRGKWIRKLHTLSRLILRVETGASITGEFSELPPSLRFFAGGDASVRGYDFETLGPKDASGEVIGGSGMLVTSVEYERTILPRWSLAAFVDSGNAFDDFDFETQTGAGIGARWHSPVGPVRVDLAKPFNGADRSMRVHVSFGPDL